MGESEGFDMTWDYIFVGGGLSASVVSHRLFQFDTELKILVVEAGPNANNRTDIIWPNSTHLVGGDFDWKYVTVKQSNLNDRNISLPCGKALGGGTVINSSGWVRGDKFDYDRGSTVHDVRWTYDGLLPYMKKPESFRNQTFDKKQRGLDGPNSIQTSWAELGIEPLPNLDGNAGDTLGVGELQENKVDGRREIAAQVYSLDGITVLGEHLVEKVLHEKCGQSLKATGIKLVNGTEIHGREIIVAAGAIRTPQILMLSGIGPAEELRKLNISVLLDHPELGNNLIDHNLFHSSWKVKDLAAGWAIDSANPLFVEPQYGWGTPADFVTASTVPKDGLVAAIREDEGAYPSASHPLLSGDRSFIEHIIMYAGAADGSLVTMVVIPTIPTFRGSVKLASTNATDNPLIDPNYLATAVDRYVVREGSKIQLRYAGSNETVIGRDILSGEVGIPGLSKTLSVDSTDEYIDMRIRAGIGTSYHLMGTAAMGKVVDNDLRVKGISDIRVVDTSVFPVLISGHLQVATFAMAEQAAEIIYADRRG